MKAFVEKVSRFYMYATGHLLASFRGPVCLFYSDRGLMSHFRPTFHSQLLHIIFSCIIPVHFVSSQIFPSMPEMTYSLYIFNLSIANLGHCPQEL